MTISVGSSAKHASPRLGAHASESRPGNCAAEGFALVAPSVALDPRTHAVRRDLADIRLADRVFAPHYAAPVARVIACETALRAERAAGGDVLTTLRPGESFELLDLAGDHAWGIAVAAGLVGYIDASALA